MPGGLDVVFIDYAQIVRNRAMPNASDVDLVANTSRTLKELAGEFECNITALAQPNRKCEDRTDKRPWMSDLKAAGQLEQDGDIISFIYRDEVYDPNTEDVGVMEIITRKYREGAIGTTKLFFDGKTGKIADLDGRYGSDFRADRVQQNEQGKHVLHLNVVQDDNDWM
jgi:replicative DNA helicase